MISSIKNFWAESELLQRNYAKAFLVAGVAVASTVAVCKIAERVLFPGLFDPGQNPEQQQENALQLKVVSASAFIVGATIPLLLPIGFKKPTMETALVATIAGGLVVPSILYLPFPANRGGLAGSSLSGPAATVLGLLNRDVSILLVSATSAGLVSRLFVENVSPQNQEQPVTRNVIRILEWMSTPVP